MSDTAQTGYAHPTTLTEFESVYSKEYEQELESCDAWIKWCERRNDFYGVNFHQGMRSAHVFNSIKMYQLLRVLKQEVPNTMLAERENGEGRTPANSNGKGEGMTDATPISEMSDEELANKLLCYLTQEMIHKSELFDYICWLEEKGQSERVPGAAFLVLASDCTTCWGDSYEAAVAAAMKHDAKSYAKENV